MIKSKLAIIIDSFFISLAIMLIIFLWLNRFIKNAILSVFFSIIISILAFIVVFKIFKKRQHLNISSNSNSKYIQNCMLYLQILDDESYIKFFERLLCATHISNFLFKVNNSYVYINIKYRVYDRDFITINNTLSCLSTTNMNIYFITQFYDESFQNLLKILPLEINTVSPNILTKIMEQKNIFPIPKEEKQKTSFKIQAKNYVSKKVILSKKQFKHLFFSGLSLLFFSLFIPYSFLYLLTGSIMLIFSIFCLFKKNENISNSDEKFLSETKKIR